MEELTDNAEEIAEEGDSTKDEKKLGRLQFKVRSLIYINRAQYVYRDLVQKRFMSTENTNEIKEVFLIFF